jgi:hypothetical protein
MGGDDISRAICTMGPELPRAELEVRPNVQGGRNIGWCRTHRTVTFLLRKIFIGSHVCRSAGSGAGVVALLMLFLAVLLMAKYGTI